MNNSELDNIQKLDFIVSEVQKINNSIANKRDWLRTNEASIYLGLSITQIHNLKRNGLLPYSKIAGTIYFKKTDIDQLLEANKVEAL